MHSSSGPKRFVIIDEEVSLSIHCRVKVGDISKNNPASIYRLSLVGNSPTRKQGR
jgi:hypothetical protein